MMLITKEIDRKLRANALSAKQNHGDGSEYPPLKLFTPWGDMTWLISERDPENPDILYGLCDIGHGSPELGSVSLSELKAARGPRPFSMLGIERDRWFTPTMSLAEYAEVARREGRVAA